MRITGKQYAFMAVAGLFTAVAFPGNAKEVTIDSASIVKLSEAVADVYASDEDGADVINIEVDQLPMDTTEIVLNKPITINGDADNNGTKCDILVDVATIKASENVGDDSKCYIEIESNGDVNISDLKIHPNIDNIVGGTGNNANLVDAIRINRQDDSTTPTHTLSRVWVSGSDASDNYVPLDNADDLYNQSGIKRWSRQSSSSAHGVINVSKAETFGTGNYYAILDNCHAGLGIGEALNIPAEGGHVTVIGGLYGHSGNNGIRVSGDVVTLTGSHTNRLRIVNVPNINSSNSHGIFDATATFDKVEWVDIATINTGRNVQVNGGIPMPMSNCRLMGKLTATNNAILYLTNVNSAVNMVDCTLIGAGSNYNPFEGRDTMDSTCTFTNCIFASEGLGQIINNNADTTGSLIFTNCAIPTDGEANESLDQTTPITMAPGIDPPNFTQTGTVSVSPKFMLTVEDYDWSEAQGEGQENNSRGNTNVYRPSNEVYLGASDDGSNLVGGAGDFPARIDSSEWMLM